MEKEIVDLLTRPDWAKVTSEISFYEATEPSQIAIAEKAGNYFNSDTDRIFITFNKADWNIIEKRLRRKKKPVPPPTLLLAGPRKMLWKDPRKIRAVIITGGGVASGLNRVIHSIVERHYNIYGLDRDEGGIIYGILDGFGGMSSANSVQVVDLTKDVTKNWMDRGGTMLGSVRGKKTDDIVGTWYQIIDNLDVDIVYIIGGNGSLTAANMLSNEIETQRKKYRKKEIVVVGIPKTMDNDILWTDRAFGFQSTVSECVRLIKALKEDAFSTRRLCLVQLFGRDSGFVAAGASLASGVVDAVLVPEECQPDNMELFDEDKFIDHLIKVLCERKEDRELHGVIVAAEGAGPEKEKKEKNLKWLEHLIKDNLPKPLLKEMKIFKSEPRHLIRAIPPTPNDQIYCQRLGDLAVDNALAGFTDFMVTRWLSQFVLVPLELVAGQTKQLDTDNLFWTQVVNATGQPSFLKKE